MRFTSLFAISSVILLSGCMWSPQDGQSQESTASIAVNGYTQYASQVVTLSVRNWTTGGTSTVVGTVTSSTAADGTGMYPFSRSLTVSTPSYWAPQLSWNGLADSGGRLELSAVAGSQLATFSGPALSCVFDKVNHGETYAQAGYECSDGSSSAVFDNSGVGSPPETTGLSVVAPFAGFPHGGGPFTVGAAKWELDRYTVQGNTVYALLCYPTSAGPHKAMIINHGGYGPVTDADRLGFCMTNANSGWVTAMSIYRGEEVQVVTPDGTLDVRSGGNIELCLGEVTDVMRLTELVRARPDVDAANVLMWGHSHGGCVTERAVERGAQVKAAVALSGPTEFASWYAAAPGLPIMLGPGVYSDLTPKPGPWAYPTTDPMPYMWRSAADFPNDLKIRSNVKMLILQGDVDPTVPPAQSCNLANAAWTTTSVNFHVGGSGVGHGPNLTTAPAGCEAFTAPTGSLSWSGGAIPYGSWPSNRYLIVYDYANHGTILDPGKQAFQDFADFVATEFP